MGGRHARSAVAAGLLLLASLMMGCAHVASPPSVGGLAARVLAPPGVGEAPPAVVDPQPPKDISATEGELLPAPREMPADGVTGPAVVNREPTRPLTLEDAISLAFQYQPRLRIFQERVEEARGRSDVAFAPFLPQVNLIERGFIGHNPSGPSDGIALPLPEFPDAPGYQNYAVSEFYLQWTMWDFGRTYGRFQQAELVIDIAQLQAARAAQTTAYEVAASYSRVLQARAARRVARESVRLAESVLDIARKSLKAGLVESDQVLRAEVQLAQSRRAVVNTERTERVAVAALNQAIGLNVSAPTEIVDRTEEEPFELSLAQCLQRAVENRREFRVARRAIEVAAEGERVAHAEFLPRIYSEAVMGEEDGHKTLHGFTSGGSINIAWSPFQGGRRLGEVRAASANFRAASAQAQVVCDTIAFEVNEAYRDVEAARQSIALARPAVTQARENLRLVTRKYEAGDATPTDIVDAETALTRAEQDLYTARYDYLTALARIDYATGTTTLPVAASPLPGEGAARRKFTHEP
jgi:outer membrane protein